MKRTSKISVIMPVYNQAKYITESISSILNQSFKDFELIIINDGSTDKTREIISSFKDPRIKYFENKNNFGITKSLNKGLRLAQGKYIARMDADDISLPKRLARQLDYLETNKEIVLVGCWIEFFGEDLGNQRKKKQIWKCPSGSDFIRYTLNYGNQLAHSSIFFRRQEVLNIGGYNENFKYAQDYDLYCRLIKRYKLDNIEEALVKYRIHKNSISFNKVSSLEQIKWMERINYHFSKEEIKDLNLEFKKYKRFYQFIVSNKRVCFRDFISIFNINRKIFQYYISQNSINIKEKRKIKEYYYNLQKMLFKKKLC